MFPFVIDHVQAPDVIGFNIDIESGPVLQARSGAQSLPSCGLAAMLLVQSQK